ncbi:RHS repeat-associated core domain-containing protein, partial [Pseudomarimonas arenosa]
PPSRFQLRRGTDYFSRDSLRTTRRWIQRYLHAPSGELLAETAPNSNTDNGAIASVYVYFAGQPVAVIRNGAVHYVYNDHLGRPEVVANSANQQVWRAKNYAFHREVMQEGGSFGALNLGFPGQYYDPETNLYYNWHRYYDPSTGRYTQADPIGLMGGVNTYGYVGGDPVGYVDPLGLRALTACEKSLLAPYIPQVDLDKADLRDGEVPWYLPKDMGGITRGNRIFFRPGEYAQGTPEGVALLGHELVHVGQYREGMTWVSYLWSVKSGYSASSKFEAPAYTLQSKVETDLKQAGTDCTCGGNP